MLDRSTRAFLSDDLPFVPEIFGKIDRSHSAFADLALFGVSAFEGCVESCDGIGRVGHSPAHLKETGTAPRVTLSRIMPGDQACSKENLRLLLGSATGVGIALADRLVFGVERGHASLFNTRQMTHGSDPMGFRGPTLRTRRTVGVNRV